MLVQFDDARVGLEAQAVPVAPQSLFVDDSSSCACFSRP